MTAKRKPMLSQEIEMLREENAKLRKTKRLLEELLAFARRELMDYQQRQAQRGNGVGR